MGFALSVIYFVTYYLTPQTIFGPLAAYRIELLIAVLALVVSLPALQTSFILKTPQSLALIGLALATFLSVVIGMHWPGGGIPTILSFIPNAYAYFLVCLHCNTKKRLQIIVLLMMFVCTFVIVQGSIELRHGPPADYAQGGDDDDTPPDTSNPYILAMRNDEGEWFYRVGGLGQINDPNDFAQLIVCTIPLTFIFWTRKKTFKNIVFVVLPVCIFLYGVFLTHSRGALIALLVVVIVAVRRRIGTVPALLIAAGLFVVASALDFTGGRDISADAGEDRTALWGEGMELLKSNPLFGVGLGGMGDYAGQTAHNSIVVCAAELGFFGLYFWSVFLFSTLRDVLVIASPAKVGEGEPITLEKTPFPQTLRKTEVIDKAEICRLGQLVLCSLSGFLAAGWFLSRAFVMTFFLLGGIAEVIVEMALQRGMIPPRMQLPRALRYSFGLAISLILVMYIMLRIINLMPH